MSHLVPIYTALGASEEDILLLVQLQAEQALQDLWQIHSTSIQASEGVRCWEVHLYRRGKSDRLVGVLCVLEPLGVLVCWVESGLRKEF